MYLQGFLGKVGPHVLEVLVQIGLDRLAQGLGRLGCLLLAALEGPDGRDDFLPGSNMADYGFSAGVREGQSCFRKLVFSLHESAANKL